MIDSVRAPLPIEVVEHPGGQNQWGRECLIAMQQMSPSPLIGATAAFIGVQNTNYYMQPVLVSMPGGGEITQLFQRHRFREQINRNRYSLHLVDSIKIGLNMIMSEPAPGIESC
ncbi:MAG: hypothetical protein M3O30_02315 [Planctomycetota bacterium]|nr:hypothetical protein [Planctomycetota bacterium]